VPLLESREAGLYCPAGDFYIDPQQPVQRAVLTHAHSDHACPGSAAYLTASRGLALVRERLGGEVPIEAVPYGDARTIGGVRVSLHPAGHILGSSQIRIEQDGEVWVVSGDYKLTSDPTCEPFEALRCHTFVTESTFALPVFRWEDEAAVIAAIEQWWAANREADRISLLLVYPLGKAQRILARLRGDVKVDPSVERYSRLYRQAGVALPEPAAGAAKKGDLLIAPPGFRRPPGASTAMASGWMRIRGPRRRQSLDRGFILSDHADWPQLLQAIDATQAESVWVTHGYTAPLARWLGEHGKAALAI